MHFPQHSSLDKLIALEASSDTRLEFHHRSQQVLKELSTDLDFLDEVLRFNFSDPGFLTRAWSLYNIPNLYIAENDDMILKYHVFVPMKNHVPGSAASTIHHHSNYVLSTTAVLGSGYETFIFERLNELDRKKEDIPLKIERHLAEEQNTQSFVDSWQPHLVFNPSKLSATLTMWTTDKKRATDSLRQNKVLKRFKGPLRKMIAAMGLENTFGITAKTLQYYVEDKQFVAIDEDEFFEPTRNAVGPEVDKYSMQTIFAFAQRMGWKNVDFLKKMLKRSEVPEYYHSFIHNILDDEPIPDVYAKETINIPRGGFMKEDVLQAHQISWGEFVNS